MFVDIFYLACREQLLSLSIHLLINRLIFEMTKSCEKDARLIFPEPKDLTTLYLFVDEHDVWFTLMDEKKSCKSSRWRNWSWDLFFHIFGWKNDWND